MVWAEVVAALGKRGITLCTVESCTGGLLSAAITAVPGASQVFVGGIVSYLDKTKSSLLKIAAEELEEHTAVSERVATLMAENGRRIMGADCAVSVTGYAGPGAPAPNLVGKVFVALADKDGTSLFRLTSCKEKDRKGIQLATVELCKEMLIAHYNLVNEKM